MHSRPRRSPAFLASSLALVGAALSFSSARARAEDPPAPASTAAPPPAAPTAEAPASPDAKLSQAKELFQRGNELRKLGDYQRALEFYQESRTLVASAPNTINAAYCLEQLGRYDEALDLYEALLTELRGQLSDEERRSIAHTAAGLRSRIGSVNVSSNVDGLVIIDGRLRGKLPLSAPVRLLPGGHTLRVVKDGWTTFEKVITVKVGEALSTDAKLEPLASSGRLRIEDERLVGADLYIDGTLIGQLPWEGSLAPGSHFYSVRKQDLGSAPREANVVAGQTAVATVEAGPLGQEIRVVVQPLTADLTINGVPVGKGQWRGTLPLGRHTIEAHEPGYFARTTRPTIDKTTAGDLALVLPIDENHPRWGHKVGIFWAEALFGYATASSLGSGAEDFCDRGLCQDRAHPRGYLVGLRGGYEFPLGVAVELTAGYLSLGTRLTRRLPASFEDPRSPGAQVPVTYAIHDDIEMTGPTVLVGGSYRYHVTPWLDVGAALGLGVSLAGIRDVVTGTVSGLGSALPITVDASGEPLHTAAPFALPELRLKLRLGSYTIGAGVALAFFLIDGPNHETGSTRVVGGPCDKSAPTVACVPPKNVVFEERSYGTFTMPLPTITVGHRF